MAKHYFVNEITKHLGDSSVLVHALLAQMSSYGIAGIEWHVRPDQHHLFTPDSSVLVVNQNEDLAMRLKSRVVQLSQNGSAGSVFHISSYDRFVLGATTALNGPDLCIVGHHLGELRTNLQGPQPTGLRSPYAVRSQFSLSDALALAKRVLTAGGHTSREKALHQKDLRPRMASLDDRARKNPSDPGSVNLITLIVRTGVYEGWLRQESRGNGQTGYEFIWVVAPASHNPQIGSAPLTTEPAPSSSPSSTTDEMARESQPHSTFGSRSSVESDPPGTHVTVRPHPPTDTPQTSSHKGATQYSQSQSKQMEDILRTRRTGTHPRTRRFLHDAFQTMLAENTDGLPLPKLRALAVEKAISAAGSTHSDKDWRTASRCFLAMMISAGALLGHDKKRILPGPCTLAGTAFGLEDKYQLRAESFLMELIIQARGGLRENELYSAGLAIYQTGAADPVPDYEIETQIASILELLLFENRIRFDGQRYSIHSNGAS